MRPSDHPRLARVALMQRYGLAWHQVPELDAEDGIWLYSLLAGEGRAEDDDA